MELNLPLSSRFLEFRYVTADSHTEGFEGVYVVDLRKPLNRLKGVLRHPGKASEGT